jgi:hypothetical protein
MCLVLTSAKLSITITINWCAISVKGHTQEDYSQINLTILINHDVVHPPIAFHNELSLLVKTQSWYYIYIRVAKTRRRHQSYQNCSESQPPIPRSSKLLFAKNETSGSTSDVSSLRQGTTLLSSACGIAEFM